METTGQATDLKNSISVDQAWFYHIVPKAAEPDLLELYIHEEKFSTDTQKELEIVLGRTVRLFPLGAEPIEKKLLQLYPRNHNAPGASQAIKLNVHADSFLETLVTEASGLGSSDIHIETYDANCRIRFRVDGVLIDRHRISKADYPTLINKIKIKAGCDIAEKRLPQDGRIHYRLQERKLDIRVSILPTLHGEKTVLRLLGS